MGWKATGTPLWTKWEESSKFIFSSQQLVKRLTVHKWSERTSPLVQGWEQVVLAVEHFQNKFSWSHDRLWQEEENEKSERSHDCSLSLHVGWLCLHSQVCFQSTQIKLVLELTPPCWWHLLMQWSLRTPWQLHNHSGLGGVRGQTHCLAQRWYSVWTYKLLCFNFYLMLWW
jgi:hypothetical protein